MLLLDPPPHLHIFFSLTLRSSSLPGGLSGVPPPISTYSGFGGVGCLRMLPSPASTFVFWYQGTQVLVSIRQRSHCTVPRSLRAATWNWPWHPSARFLAYPLREDLREKTKKRRHLFKKISAPSSHPRSRHCLSSQVRDDHLHTFPRFFLPNPQRPKNTPTQWNTTLALLNPTQPFQQYLRTHRVCCPRQTHLATAD